MCSLLQDIFFPPFYSVLNRKYCSKMHYFVGSTFCHCYYRIIIFWNCEDLLDQQVHFPSVEDIQIPKRNVLYYSKSTYWLHQTLLLANIDVCYNLLYLTKFLLHENLKRFYHGCGCLNFCPTVYKQESQKMKPDHNTFAGGKSWTGCRSNQLLDSAFLGGRVHWVMLFAYLLVRMQNMMVLGMQNIVMQHTSCKAGNPPHT